ncbi:MAG TPA: nitronate monooxygenase [Deltaproteobacteria bacterium]|nr:nitronate monooxygenase [Deltaproteobacteria bacterium]HPR54684.1 nitronate monooxygenase [Deltaproteobacteria bacterium]HXK46652.1 nitronate monooxygenase [Deltaproteobacteria bacterium]
MIKTAITEMFGVDYPIICGSMMWLCTPELCAAISEAGGLGNLTCGNYETEEDLRAAIARVRELTSKPFMMGLTLMPSVRITEEMNRMYVRVAAEEKVAGMEVSGAPLDRALGKEALTSLKKAGVRVFHKVGCVKHGIHAQKSGYDGVYCLGFEAGGHPYQDNVGTMVLTPRMVDKLDIPVVTVGGIADGRAMAAALTLGAQGVMMASRFLTTRECDVHDTIKQELIDRTETDTVIFGGKALGMQGRALKNGLIEKVLAVEEKGGGLEELFPLISGQRIKDAWKNGEVNDAPFMVGQCIGHIHEIMSCRQVLETMCADARKHLSQAGALFQ